VVGRPGLLLADEPTAHLDADTSRDVATIFREFNQVGVTVVIATYDDRLFPEARQVALDHGKVAA
jgi:cell division transport system ATP-binding protein